FCCTCLGHHGLLPSFPTRRSSDLVELVLKSGRRLAARLVASAEGRFGTMREDAGIGARAWSYNQVAIVVVARHELPHRGVAGDQDRKSTRLNSSHRTISYAVFCLK